MNVSIRKIDNYNLPELEEAIKEFFRSLGSQRLKRAKRIIIKPNLLGAFAPERAVTTHPMVVEAIVRYFLERNKEVVIADSNGGSTSIETVWQKCGYSELADKYPVKLVNLSTYGLKAVYRNGFDLKLSKMLYESGVLINVAKLKTHSLMAFTGAIKNLYGLIPGMIKSEYHKNFPDTNRFGQLLNAVYQEARPRVVYNIIDGIQGMDGAGPSAGRLRNFSLLLGSASASCLDYYASRLMGFKIDDIPYLFDALHADGILPSRIQIPSSFLHHRLEDVDIKVVKLHKDILRFVPASARILLKKLLDYYPIITERCLSCGVCVKSCPVKAITYRPDSHAIQNSASGNTGSQSSRTAPARPFINKDKCIKCMCCHELCPHNAIDIHKSFVSRFVV